MARYSGEGNHATGAINDSSIFVEQGATVRRFKAYDCMVGSSATPADNAAEYSLYRATGGSPAGSAVTEQALDPADVASLSVALSALSTEPTGKTSIINFPVNMRATYRWVAAPGSEVVVPATADAGFGVEKLVTTASFAFDTVVLWEE